MSPLPPHQVPVAEGLHPALAPLAPLLGEWIGPGHGEYPTIEPFDYLETLRFEPRGDKPFLAYAQHSRDGQDGRPMHLETGYLRPAGPDRAELVIAQPTGIVEVDEGTLVVGHDGLLELTLRSRHLGLTSTAKEVTEIERRFRLEGAVLRTTLHMAAVGHPRARHLTSQLRRSPSPLRDGPATDGS